jgi:hypothetical protein
MIDDKLFQVLTAPAAPVFASLGTRVYLETAAQRVEKPYCVIILLGKVPIHTMEGNPSALRRWHFRFEVTGDDVLQVRGLARSISDYLVGYTDRPAAGIQRMLDLNEGPGWDEPERSPQAWCDLDIMENLP